MVPLTGGCDGLPDDPPRRGQGPGVTFDTPIEALADFLRGTTIDDRPLPTGGYTEVEIDGITLSYVIAGDDPIVVVDALRTGEGWTIEGWSAAR